MVISLPFIVDVLLMDRGYIVVLSGIHISHIANNSRDCEVLGLYTWDIHWRRIFRQLTRTICAFLVLSMLQKPLFTVIL